MKSDCSEWAEHRDQSVRIITLSGCVDFVCEWQKVCVQYVH